MRNVINSQKTLGQIDIAKIEIDLKCRDEMPKILLGLQHIYRTPELKEQVFTVLKEIIPREINPENGRPGMDLWKILVLGCVRLCCNWDYDKLHDIANNHKSLREMLGFGLMDEKKLFNRQTIVDNVSLFTPETLDRINQIVVGAGLSLLSGKKNEKFEIEGRCDSFVLETDVHFPTDINLLFDAIRKVVTLISRICREAGIKGWRQSRSNLRKIKRLFRTAQSLKRSTSKDETKKAQREEKIKQAHQEYIELVEFYLAMSEESILELQGSGSNGVEIGIQIVLIETFIKHAYRQIDQIRRRVIEGKVIPHEEKVFSIFEDHTEWISKGKAGVPQELGLKVCILEERHGFLLHHRVMENERDDEVAVRMVEETKKMYPNFTRCSFDKGFHNPENQKELRKLLEFVILPRKGKLSPFDRLLENSPDFVKGRRSHSAVESGINGLENHGLDRCLDHGIVGFKRYVSCAILARNIEKLGCIIHLREVKKLKIKETKKAIEAVRLDKQLRKAA
jgi:hypothetical protein